MLYVLIVILAIFILIHFLSKKGPVEGYEDYDEPTCLILAKKNQENLISLHTSVDKLMSLQDKIQSIQNTTDANTKQLSTLTDQVFKTSV